MGIHICVVDLDGSDHPDWDYLRQGSDSTFPDVLDDNFTLRDDDQQGPFMPNDTVKLRQEIDRHFLFTAADKRRYNHLVDLIERDGWWLYLNY